MSANVGDIHIHMAEKDCGGAFKSAPNEAKGSPYDGMAGDRYEDNAWGLKWAAHQQAALGAQQVKRHVRHLQLNAEQLNPVANITVLVVTKVIVVRLLSIPCFYRPISSIELARNICLPPAVRHTDGRSRFNASHHAFSVGSNRSRRSPRAGS